MSKKGIVKLLLSISVVITIVLSATIITNAHSAKFNFFKFKPHHKPIPSSVVKTPPKVSPKPSLVASITPQKTPDTKPSSSNTNSKPTVSPTKTQDVSPTPNIDNSKFNIQMPIVSTTANTTIRIPISFLNSNKVNNCNFAIKFDSNAFSYKSVEIGEIIPSSQASAFGYFNPSNDLVVFKYVDPTQGNYPISAKGVFAYLTLNVSPTIAAGTYSLEPISNDARYSWDFADTDLNPINVNFISGKISIAK